MAFLAGKGAVEDATAPLFRRPPDPKKLFLEDFAKLRSGVPRELGPAKPWTEDIDHDPSSGHWHEGAQIANEQDADNLRHGVAGDERKLATTPQIRSPSSRKLLTTSSRLSPLHRSRLWGHP